VLNQSKIEVSSKISFPVNAIRGLAGEFADLYSSYLESPWTFLAFNFLTCLGSIISDRITLASEIAPQPRHYTVNLGKVPMTENQNQLRKPYHSLKEQWLRENLKSVMAWEVRKDLQENWRSGTWAKEITSRL